MLTDGARMSSSLLDQPLPGNSSSMVARIANWTRIRSVSQHSSRSNSSYPANLANPLPELCSLISPLLSPAFPKARHKSQSLSLVEPMLRDGESSLRMHDLVHFITREHVKRHRAYQAWLESTVSIVCCALRRVEDPESPRWWPECEKFIPQVRPLSKAWTGVEGMNVDLAKADVFVARYLDSRGRYDDAEKLCVRSVGSLRKELGDEQKDALSALSIPCYGLLRPRTPH
jgi:hypothetical protein